MKHSDSIGKVAAALVAAQADIKAVEKSATNPHFKSKYAPLDAIIAMVRPALAVREAAVMQSASASDDGKALIVETRVVHASGEWMANEVFIPLQKSDPQGAGAALTYGRRFGLSAMLCIATDDDDDGNAASRPPVTRTTVTPRPLGAAALQPQDISREQARGQGVSAGATNGKPDADKLMPFGKNKGKRLGDIETAGLESTLAWCKEKGKADMAQAIEHVLASR